MIGIISMTGKKQHSLFIGQRRINSGLQWDGSTMDLETVTWYVPVNQLIHTGRRHSSRWLLVAGSWLLGVG
jgi:hypothetical protein